jgi:hypothetical protein
MQDWCWLVSCVGAFTWCRHVPSALLSSTMFYFEVDVTVACSTCEPLFSRQCHFSGCRVHLDCCCSLVCACCHWRSRLARVGVAFALVCLAPCVVRVVLCVVRCVRCVVRRAALRPGFRVRSAVGARARCVLVRVRFVLRLSVSCVGCACVAGAGCLCCVWLVVLLLVVDVSGVGVELLS